MKLIIILALAITTSAFATETKTECPWMREMNKRSNPKANLSTQKIKENVDVKSVIQKE